MEFKLDGTAEEALRQINDKQYAFPFMSDDRRVFKIGVNFSLETAVSKSGWWRVMKSVSVRNETSIVNTHCMILSSFFHDSYFCFII